MMPILRTAFTGGRLGFTNRKYNKLPVLGAYSYRMTLVCTAQPGRTWRRFPMRRASSFHAMHGLPDLYDCVTIHRMLLVAAHEQ